MLVDSVTLFVGQADTWKLNKDDKAFEMERALRR